MKKVWRNPIALYFCANWLYRHHVPVLPRLLQLLLFLIFGAVVPYKVEIGSDCVLSHGGNGVVIHPRVRIGRNVIIHQQVTIGGTGTGNVVPTIGNDVYIGAGAKILGPVTVGNNSVIGANAVVVKSVPSRCVAAGVPARIIREDVDAHTVEEW
jgi:serine O-acetyltransferase